MKVKKSLYICACQNKGGKLNNRKRGRNGYSSYLEYPNNSVIYIELYKPKKRWLPRWGMVSERYPKFMERGIIMFGQSSSLTNGNLNIPSRSDDDTSS